MCAGVSFSVQITEVFPGAGYKNSKVCLVSSRIRLNREGYLIETLRTFYLNVLNERKRKAGPNLPAGFIFLPNPRSKQ